MMTTPVTAAVVVASLACVAMAHWPIGLPPEPHLMPMQPPLEPVFYTIFHANGGQQPSQQPSQQLSQQPSQQPGHQPAEFATQPAISGFAREVEQIPPPRRHRRLTLEPPPPPTQPEIEPSSPAPTNSRPLVGVKGELSIKWSVAPFVPIAHHRRRRFLEMIKQQDSTRTMEAEEEIDGSGPDGPLASQPPSDRRRRRRRRRTRRQINLDLRSFLPTMRKMLTNATGLMDDIFGQRMSRQLQTQMKQARRTMSGVFETMSNGLKRLVDTPRPGRDTPLKARGRPEPDSDEESD